MRQRISNIYSSQQQLYQATSSYSECSNTPTKGSTSQRNFPSSSTQFSCLPSTSSFKPMTVNSCKKPISSSKMDFYSYNSEFSTFPDSSLSSIYDHDKSHYNSYCGSSMFAPTAIDYVSPDDVSILDDNMEDGSLENLLTPDVINSINDTATITSSSELWAGKLEHDVSMPAVSDSPNPTLPQIDMEGDFSFNDMMNIDADDSKLNFTVDFLCGEINDFITQPNFNTVSSSSSALGFLSQSADSSRCTEAAISLTDVSLDNKNINDTSSNFSSFPPRTSQPPLIGFATVIKPELKETFTTSDKADDDLQKLKAQSPLPKLEAQSPLPKLKAQSPLQQLKEQSPNLHKLLSTKPLSECSEIKAHADSAVQIVPTSRASKRTHANIIKSEPLSPSVAESVEDKTTEEKWKDIEHFMSSPSELPTKKKRCDSWNSSHMSDEDEDDSSPLYGDKDGYDDSDDDYSDIDADLAHISPSECESLVALGKKQKQYFWQYNVQSKGPKGTRLKLSVDSPSDPHVLNDFEDPVFDECNTAIAGIRHGGKARKGDGNEITPNPRKLFMIGHQLLRLNRQINACQLGSDVPAARRNESRKEKNKLASRACRLKKKAQHEANKIKLYGLEQEHSQLNSVLQFIWPHIQEKCKVLLGHSDKSVLSSTSTTLTDMLESQITSNLKSMVAGHTADYVNSVIMKVESGDNCGGLNIRKNHKT